MIAELVNPGGGGGLPKFKQGPPSPIEQNPISQQFEIGRLVGSAGPEFLWKIYDAKRKSDNKVRSIPISRCRLIPQLSASQTDTDRAIWDDDAIRPWMTVICSETFSLDF